MAESHDHHLGDNEIEALSWVETSRDDRKDVVEEQDLNFDSGLRSARQHLESCAQCRNMVAMMEKERQKFRAIVSQGQRERTPECPYEDAWLDVAGGLLAPYEAERLSRHAAECGYCGPLLRQAVQDLQDEVGPEEREFFAELHRKPKVMSIRLRATRSLAVWATAAIVLVAVGGIWLWRQRSTEIDLLLAQAYRDRRTIETRFPGAPYAPVAVERGHPPPSRSLLQGALLRAEASLAERIAAHPDDARWIDDRGRAALLAWDYEAAIQDFQRALELQPGTPEYLSDLASAHYERAQATGKTADYGVAAERLGEALHSRPNDPVLLFNRAVVNEQLFLYEKSVADWEQFLKVERDGNWAAEGKQRLEEVQKKKIEPGLPKDPLASLTNDSISIEYALDYVLSSWLGREDSSQSLEGARQMQAVRNLAKILRREHGDAWLEDELPFRVVMHEAYAQLQDAVVANQKGDPVRAINQAQKAINSFRSGNQAGVLRARLERVYAFHRNQAPDRCAQEASELLKALHGHAYPWIEAQADLERSVCVSMHGNLEEGRTTLDRGLALAAAHRYPILQMRGEGLHAALRTAMGNATLGWSEDLAGVSRYWQGAFPYERGYQFYSDLSYIAQRSHEWHLATSFSEQAQSLAARTGNGSLYAMAVFRTAYLARSAGINSESLKQYALAHSLFQALQGQQDVRVYQIDGEVSVAELQASQGNLDISLQRLEEIRKEVDGSGRFPLQLRYYQTLASIYLRRGEIDLAENVLRSAIAVAERGSTSLKSVADRASWRQQTGNAYRGEVGVLLRNRHQEVAALRLWEWYRAKSHDTVAASVRGSNGGLPMADPLDVQRVAPDTTLLVYAQLVDGIAIWQIDRQGIAAHWVPVEEAQFNRVAERFAEQCADPGSRLATIQRDGRQLYQWLLAPVQNNLPAGRALWIEPDGLVSRIPFPALIAADGRYFGADHAVGLSLGLSREDEADATPMTREHALVIGNPSMGAEWALAFPSLADARQEARDVAGQFMDHTLLESADASVIAVQSELPNAGVFHFAGHALTGPVEGLLLASGHSAALLDTGAIEHMQLRRCRLAVLSACSTGQGASRSNEDPANLGTAFLNAGTREVVAMQWSVDSASTRDLMRLFYSELLNGADALMALHRAMESTRQSSAVRAHPYYWAAPVAYARRSPWTIYSFSDR